MDEQGVAPEISVGAIDEKVKNGKEPLPSGGELLLLLNGDSVHFRERRGFNGFGCFDDKGNQLPFLVRIVGAGDDPARMEYSSGKHIELLGDEFVYELQRSKIIDPQKVEAIRQRLLVDIQNPDWKNKLAAERASFDVFVQRLREEAGSRYPLWEYVVKFYDKMDPLMRQKMVLFIERLGKAIDQGWVFDLPSFPETEDGVKNGKNRDNVVVDGEGPVFLDVEEIWNAKEDPRHVYQNKEFSLSCQVVLGLLKNQICLDEAFSRIENGHTEIVSSLVNLDAEDA